MLSDTDLVRNDLCFLVLTSVILLCQHVCVCVCVSVCMFVRVCAWDAAKIACCPPPDVVPLEDLALTCPEAGVFPSDHLMVRGGCTSCHLLKSFWHLQEYLELRGECDAPAMSKSKKRAAVFS